MTNRGHLWSIFGEVWGWPTEDLTLEQDLIDLGWHQKECQMRSSFDYAVMSLDEKRLFGCVYVDPPEKAGYDAEVHFWAKRDGPEQGLEASPIPAGISRGESTTRCLITGRLAPDNTGQPVCYPLHQLQ